MINGQPHDQHVSLIALSTIAKELGDRGVQLNASRPDDMAVILSTVVWVVLRWAALVENPTVALDRIAGMLRGAQAASLANAIKKSMQAVIKKEFPNVVPLKRK